MMPPTDEDIKVKKRLKIGKSLSEERKSTLKISLIIELIGAIIIFISLFTEWPDALRYAKLIYFALGLVAILYTALFTIIALYTLPSRFPGCFGTCGPCIAMFVGFGITFTWFLRGKWKERKLE